MNELFSAEVKRVSKKFGRADNYVRCAQCGRVIYRNRYSREHVKNSFCSHSCQGLFNKGKLKIASRWRWTPSYDQHAFGVSLEIAEAYRTGEWPK